jgi:hypothetical protein
MLAAADPLWNPRPSAGGAFRTVIAPGAVAPQRSGYFLACSK